MRLWALIVLVSLVQELASSNAVFFEAYRAGYPLWIIHIIYAAATLFDIIFFYLLGSWMRNTYPEHRIIRFVRGFGERIEERAGKMGVRAAIFTAGVLNFTQIDAFALSWLSYSFSEVMVLLFVSNAVAYAIQWFFILGVQVLIPGQEVVIGVIIVGPLALALATRLLRGAFERL